MPPEEIKKLQERNAELEGQVATLQTQVTELTETVAKKDELIEQKNQDIIGARRKYKPLKEMSDEEKANMSEQDLARKEEQDLIYEQQEQERQQREADRTKEIQSRKSAAIKALVGDDTELAAKLEKNFNSIKDADAAYTQEEIGTFMKTAFNMLGDEKPEPVRSAVNAGLVQAPTADENGSGGNGYADTQDGKDLGASLGLHSATAPSESEGTQQ